MTVKMDKTYADDNNVFHRVCNHPTEDMIRKAVAYYKVCYGRRREGKKWKRREDCRRRTEDPREQKTVVRLDSLRDFGRGEEEAGHRQPKHLHHKESNRRCENLIAFTKQRRSLADPRPPSTGLHSRESQRLCQLPREANRRPAQAKAGRLAHHQAVH